MIGIFDSGIGGLTVYKDIARAFPRHQLVYVGDTARVPYGPRGRETVLGYSRQLIRFLSRLGVDIVVVACNTSSAVALPTLQNEFNIPLIGVIEPTAKSAVTLTRNGRIGVIGTKGTIESSRYKKVLQRMAPRAQVFTLACPLFVPLIEEGLAQHRLAEVIAKYYLTRFNKTMIDTLILGCTHYPLLEPVIQRTVGSQVKLISSGKPVVARLRQFYRQKQRAVDVTSRGHPLFYCTDDPAYFKDMTNKLLGQKIMNVKKLSLSKL